MIEKARFGDDWDKTPVEEVNKYPAFIDEPENLAKALGVYPPLAVLILFAMIYNFVLKRCKNKSPKIRRRFNSLNRKIYYNTLIRFALELDLKLTHQAISVVFFVGMTSLQISVIHGVFVLLIVAFPVAVICFLTRKTQKLSERKMTAKYGTLYQGIKTESKSTAIFSGAFLLRRLFIVCIVVFLNDYAFFKPMAFLWMEVFYLIWVGWTKPHQDSWYNFLDRLNEVGLIFIGYILFLQTAFMDDQVLRYHLGWAAIWICVVLYFFNFISMVVVFFRELRHAYRMYSVKRKFILQYSRKGMIEQNYFKSTKDTGLRSKLKSSKSMTAGQSSRDSGSPLKERRRRRRSDGRGKSLLVAKNDVDDVYEAGEDLANSHSKDRHTREFEKKLRDAELA